jgi:RHS repeat-associated protein
VRVSVVNGRLHAGGASPNNLVYVAVPTETGKTYRVSCDVDLAGGVKLRTYAQDQSSMPFKNLSTTTIASDQHVTYTFLAYAATTYVIFEHYLSGIRDFYLDNLLIEKMSLGGSYSQRLNGSGNERIGLAKSIRVMPGDTVTAVVFAKYLDPDPDHWTASVKTIVDLIAGNMAPPLTLVDGGLPGSTGGMVFPMSDVIDKNGENGAAPRAYLNWLFFDRRMRLKDFGFERVSETAREYGQDTMHQRLEVSVPIKEAGYVYLYLSNDTHALGGPMIEVYFDDFEVKHTKSRLVQCQDYYPFGLVFGSYSRENSVTNPHQYNGKEMQDELGIGWVDFGRRMYHPDLGRFMAMDRFSEKFFPLSPFQFAADNPLSFVDINGDSIIAITRLGQNISIENSPSEEGGENFTNTINFQSDVSIDNVSDYSAGIVNDAMIAIGDNFVTVSSGIRTSSEQANAMYYNLETGSVEGEKNTYGSAGDKVIDTYVAGKNETKAVTKGCEMIVEVPVNGSAKIRQMMTDKINEVGPSNVSNHTVNDPSTINVFDIRPSSISSPAGFHNSLSGDSRVKRVLSKVNKPAEKAIHVEILQNN